MIVLTVHEHPQVSPWPRVPPSPGCQPLPQQGPSMARLQLPAAQPCLAMGPTDWAHIPAWPCPVPIPQEVPGAGAAPVPPLPCSWLGWWDRSWCQALPSQPQETVLNPTPRSHQRHGALQALLFLQKHTSSHISFPFPFSFIFFLIHRFQFKTRLCYKACFLEIKSICLPNLERQKFPILHRGIPVVRFIECFLTKKQVPSESAF